MCVSKIASRSFTETPRAPSSFRSVSSVDPGPGSTIARWPSDSSKAVPIERGLPSQWSSRAVILCIGVRRSSVTQDAPNALSRRGHPGFTLALESEKMLPGLRRREGRKEELLYAQARYDSDR